jgi:hypothetical protein
MRETAKEFLNEKKSIFLTLGIPVCLLVFGLIVAGCDNGTNAEPDTWSDVTSLAQLNGTWKSSQSSTESEEGITATIVYELVVTIAASDNASTGTAAMTMSVITSFSGAGIDDMWDVIKSELGPSEPGDGDDVDVAFDDANHSVTVTTGMSPTDITLAAMDGIQINQHGTKVKLPADNPLATMLGRDETKPSEVILDKQ